MPKGNSISDFLFVEVEALGSDWRVGAMLLFRVQSLPFAVICEVSEAFSRLIVSLDFLGSLMIVQILLFAQVGFTLLKLMLGMRIHL